MCRGVEGTGIHAHVCGPEINISVFFNHVSILLFLLFLILCVCARRGRKRVLESVELELELVTNSPLRVLGTKQESSGKSDLNC